MANPKPTPPAMLWAQSSTDIFVTISMECNDSDYKFTEDTFTFKGTSAVDKASHEVSLDLFSKVKPDTVKCKNIGRCVEFTVQKEDSTADYWPRLNKQNQKLPFLRVDFKKWVDEDDVEAPKMPDGMFDDMNFGQNFMDPKAGAGAGMGNLDFYDDEEEDSDDDLDGPPPAEDVISADSVEPKM